MANFYQSCVMRLDQLEGCLDDDCQLQTVKRSQAPGDATVQKQFFVVDQKE